MFASCSIPQVEDAKCTVSRDTVRSFYSTHFADGDKMGFTRENVTKKEKFLTPELYKLLLGHFDREEKYKTEHPDARQIDEDILTNGDPFSGSMGYPTGFKVGECKITGENNITHTVRLFWKIDNKPTLDEIQVLTEKRGDQWLIGDFAGRESYRLTEELK